MDYVRPVEAIIPGATGRILAALSRVEAELPVSTLAAVAGVGRTRASGIISELTDLGIVERREVGRTILVSLARGSAAGNLIDRLAHLHGEVIDRLRDLARDIDPSPETLLVFGSFARGTAAAGSDIDILAVPPVTANPDEWEKTLSAFVRRASALTANPVQVLEYGHDDLRRRAGPRAELGRDFWTAVRRDAILLAGKPLDDLIGRP